MSRFVMKKDWFCLGDDYTIQDAAGEAVLKVDGKVFCIGDQLSIQTMDGRELGYIDQKLLHWGPTYEIYRSGALAAVIKKSVFTLFHCKFTVDVPGPDDLVAEGDFWEHEYSFRRHGRQIATVSERYFSLTHSYGIDVPHGEDPVLIVAAAVVIDLCCHQSKKE